jgi:NitT/TauT family transport system substrate-binding protein
VIKIVAAAAAILLGVGAAHSAEPLNIRIGWVIAPGSIAPLLMLKPELSVHRGTSYTIEATHFVSSAVELVPLASGQLDMADVSYSLMSSAIENAHLDDLRIFADEIQNGIDGHENGSGFLVLKDGPIKQVEDLKGKVIAVLTLGSATDMQARVLMHRHGFEDKRDYSLIEAQFPNMKSLLVEGKAAMVAIAPPYAFDPELRAQSRMFATETDTMGPTQLIALGARQGFLDKNHAVLVDFMEDVIRTVRWYIDPKNHDAAVALVAAFNKQPPEQLARLFTKEDNYRSPNSEPNLVSLQHSLDLQHEMGIQKTAIDAQRYADLTIVHEAAARLK